jgi:hypothetical protein
VGDDPDAGDVLVAAVDGSRAGDAHPERAAAGFVAGEDGDEDDVAFDHPAARGGPWIQTR